MTQKSTAQSSQKIAVIIGAGPAGLTAAYELLQHTDIKPVIIETEDYCGGLSATINHNNNGIDIGGHRFYSKSSWVMQWWQKFLPVKETGSDQSKNDEVMLVKNRLSRILFLGKLFDYPLKFSWKSLKQFPLPLIFRLVLSYIKAKCCPVYPQKNLEDFYINRFGKALYLTFFKHYTYKVWGVDCKQISADWGPQRVKDLSAFAAIRHAILDSTINKIKAVFGIKSLDELSQKNTPTSLIDKFLYPKKGPGQLWQAVAKKVVELGGEIHYGQSITALLQQQNKVSSVEITHHRTGAKRMVPCQLCLSSMPIKNLITAMGNHIPEKVSRIADGLCYRDYIIVGLSLKKAGDITSLSDANDLNAMQDNWLYIQDTRVALGRVQLFHNWSPALVKDSDSLWLGLEYFCQEGDELWQKTDDQMTQFAIDEITKIQLLKSSNILDSKVIRVKKAYPAYFGSYGQIDIIKDYVNRIENLYLIGRNGMHKYNNQDHSMITARAAVDCIISGTNDKSAIWQVNTEDDYLEQKKKLPENE